METQVHLLQHLLETNYQDGGVRVCACVCVLLSYE